MSSLKLLVKYRLGCILWLLTITLIFGVTFNFKKLKLLSWVKLSKSRSKKTSSFILRFKFNNWSEF